MELANFDAASALVGVYNQLYTVLYYMHFEGSAHVDFEINGFPTSIDCPGDSVNYGVIKKIMTDRIAEVSQQLAALGVTADPNPTFPDPTPPADPSN